MQEPVQERSGENTYGDGEGTSKEGGGPSKSEESVQIGTEQRDPGGMSLETHTYTHTMRFL